MKEVPESLRLAHLYLLRSLDAAAEAKERDRIRATLMPWIKENCEKDENGSYFYEFPDPINIDDIWYSGIQVQRRVSEYVDEERVLRYLAEDSAYLWERCTNERTVRDLDMDEVYACNQEGLIPDEDIDSFIETDETWALVKVKK